MKNFNTIKLLCYSGLIPFYALSILSFNIESIIIFDLFSIYSLVILSFLFGSNWLNLIIVQTKGNSKRFLFFVILSPIFLIICEIFFRLEIKFFVYAIFYFLVQIIDNKFITNFDYLKIRKNLTILVIISHIIILSNIYSNGI